MTGHGGSTGGGRPEPGTVESLYPFLYSGTSDLEAVLADVRRSTVAKTAEITELRRAIAAQDGARLARCAADAAARARVQEQRGDLPGVGRAARVRAGQRHRDHHGTGQRRGP
jgi:hypothetical protein